MPMPAKLHGLANSALADADIGVAPIAGVKGGHVDVHRRRRHRHLPRQQGRRRRLELHGLAAERRRPDQRRRQGRQRPVAHRPRQQQVQRGGSPPRAVQLSRDQRPDAPLPRTSARRSTTRRDRGWCCCRTPCSATRARSTPTTTLSTARSIRRNCESSAWWDWLSARHAPFARHSRHSRLGHDFDDTRNARLGSAGGRLATRRHQLLGFAYAMPTLAFVVVFFLTPLLLVAPDVAQYLAAAHRRQGISTSRRISSPSEQPAVLAGGRLHDRIHRPRHRPAHRHGARAGAAGAEAGRWVGALRTIFLLPGRGRSRVRFAALLGLLLALDRPDQSDRSRRSA